MESNPDPKIFENKNIIITEVFKYISVVPRESSNLSIETNSIAFDELFNRIKDIYTNKIENNFSFEPMTF